MAGKPSKSVCVGLWMVVRHTHDRRYDEALERQASIEPHILSIAHALHCTISIAATTIVTVRSLARAPHPNRKALQKGFCKALGVGEHTDGLRLLGGSSTVSSGVATGSHAASSGIGALA